MWLRIGLCVNYIYITWYISISKAKTIMPKVTNNPYFLYFAGSPVGPNHGLVLFRTPSGGHRSKQTAVRVILERPGHDGYIMNESPLFDPGHRLHTEHAVSSPGQRGPVCLLVRGSLSPSPGQRGPLCLLVRGAPSPSPGQRGPLSVPWSEGPSLSLLV